ncbi:MAG: DUF2867 domain-containing protein [Pseudomonadales bacterium]|nr:DUF2867 domain-containing protein [Pseudomonadales bacterium]
MKFRIDKIDVPIDSEISNNLADAYYFDSYRFLTEHKNRSSLQIWLDHASKTPAWINFMMAARNNIASALGLKNLGHLGAVDTAKAADDYQIGDRVGIFTLLSINENEVILGDADKHLDVKVSVYKESKEGNLISISTVVHVHNLMGKVYMLIVTPLHKLIVQSTIIRAES